MLAFCDGERLALMPPARDYKAAHDGDRGPNTGGMGAYSRPGFASPELMRQVRSQILEPVVAEMAARGHPFVGALYAGLMITPDGPKVLEFNCRFGDPETQAILPRLQGDLLASLAAAAAGHLDSIDVEAAEEAAVTVVLAAHGYPEGRDSGSAIEGVREAEAEAIVFHAGTAMRGSQLVTNGGRILDVTALGPSIDEARERAYAACNLISFEGMRFRADIAAKAASVAT